VSSGVGERGTGTMGDRDLKVLAGGLGKFQVLWLDWRTSRTAAAASATFCWYTLSRADQEATEIWERVGEATTVGSEVNDTQYSVSSTIETVLMSRPTTVYCSSDAMTMYLRWR